MPKNLIIGTVVVLVLGGLGIFVWQRSATNPGASPVSQSQNQNQTKTEGRVVAGYQGRVLAGNKAPYLIFTKVDYDRARAENKIIILDFFANWCPICRAEAPGLRAGFDSLETDKVIGFRVNFNDSDTDEDEKALARQFNVPYQHTKIILKDGKEVGRSAEQWDKETFLREIGKVL